MSYSENARERDLYKYYQPWLDVKKMGNVPANYKHGNALKARSSHDKALMAFAQLGAIRLNMKRAMISLIDSKTQTILAEATRSLSLVDDNRHLPGDHIWLGNVSFPRADAVDVHVFGSKYTASDENGQTQTFEALVIPDLRDDSRFKDKDYVTAENAVRFYAGVPIKTNLGHAIGTFAVSDAVPHQRLSREEMGFMQDMALTVFEHLEMVKSRSDRDRGEKMVKSLARFIEDVSQMRYATQTSKENGNSAEHNSASRKNDQTNHTEAESPDMQTSNKTEGIGPHSDGKGAPTSTDDRLPKSPKPKTVGKSWQGSTKSTEAGTPMADLQQVFIKAADVMRKSIGADGCIFFDASSGTFGDSKFSSHQSNQSGTDDLQTSDSDSGRNHSSHSISSSNVRKSRQTLTGTFADVLGTSFEDYEMTSGGYLGISEMDLKRCLQHYPNGHIFNFDEAGSVSSGDDLLSDQTTNDEQAAEEVQISARRRRRTKGRFLPSGLFQLLPNIRALIFLPLFDFSQDRWYAGGFLWTSRLGRFAGSTDFMPYLKAFASCIMTEVGNMETLSTSRAKTTFIASISHELRSPLHGILGSIEFLEETLTTAHQQNLIESIEMCGKTLLDTIEHLLDFAKINDLTKSLSKKRPSRRRRKSASEVQADITGTSTALIADINIAHLVEDVVEVVFTGQTFRKASSRFITSDHPHRNASHALHHIRNVKFQPKSDEEHPSTPDPQKFTDDVIVMLEIAKTTSWWVRSQPGGLRRIIMNLFGNAIKYCSTGFIEVALNVIHNTGDSLTFEFIVKDTGKGMSKQFMKNHLFRAFAQEDTFSYGTGLGLSIVKQIVDSLRGDIEIKSEKGVGTTVTTTLTLPLVEHPPYDDEDDQIFRDARAKLSGKTACLLDSHDTNTDKRKRDRVHKIYESLSHTCKTWFDITVVESQEVDSGADIFLYAEPPPVEKLMEHHSQRKQRGNTWKETPLIIVCTNVAEATAVRSGGVGRLNSCGRVVEVISQPCGPNKLAKVLRECLRRLEALELEDEEKLQKVESEHSQEDDGEQKDTKSPKVSSPLGEQSSSGQVRPELQRKEQSVVAKSSLPSPAGELPPEIAFRKLDLGPVRLQISNATENNDKRPFVLLVDDNPINLKLLVTFMKKVNLPAVEATNGLEAVEAFKSSPRPFDYVLMDISMPVMDGLTATRRIREYERQVHKQQESDGVETDKKQVTIIALTGLASGNIQDEAFEAGVSQFLTKPARFKQLKETLGLET